MKTTNLDLIDFQKVDVLLEGFNKTTGFVTAILDLEGNILSKSGWRPICTQFHRINPQTAANCKISDTELANKLSTDKRYHFYRCLNGLVDVAVPLIIKGEHVANLFTGQFLFEAPDMDFFIRQADKYGFNKEEYLEKIAEIPIVTMDRVQVVLDFLLNMTQLISEISFQKKEQVELNEALKVSEERSRNVLDYMLEGCQIIGFDWTYIYLNHAAELHNRRPNSELLGKKYIEMWPGIEQTLVYAKIRKVLESRESDHFENEFSFPDGNSGWFDLSIQPVPEGVFILSIDITERKQKEKLLYESEFRFSRLYESGPFGMVLADNTFHFKKSNPAFCEMMGYTEAELLNLTFRDLTHPEDLAKDLANVKMLMNREIPVYKTEKRYIRKDGVIIWASLTVTSTYDSEGNFLYNLGVIEDISKRKVSEEQISLLNERISTATRVSQVGIWDWNVAKNELNWDEQMYVLYGKSKGEFSGAYEAWVNGLHPDDRVASMEETQLALDGVKEYNTTFRVIWPDGTVRILRARGEVFRNDKGEPVRMIGINIDITEQRKAEEIIRKKDLEFRKLSANVPGLIFQFTRRPDGSYYVPVASAGIRNIFGCEPEDVLNDFDAIGRVLYPEDAERVLQDIEYSADNLTYFTCEFRVKIPGRNIQWIYSQSTPEMLEDGSVTWYGFNADITELKAAEEKVKKLNESLEQRVFERTSQLEAANKELEAFSYSVSHDLRAPLRHINGYVDLLKNRFAADLPEKAQYYIETVADASRQMGALIDDLLQFSRTGRQEIRQVMVNMNDLVGEVIAGLKQDQKGRFIHWDIAQLPEVSGDFSLLKLVWVNLIDNAVKYTRLVEFAEISISCKQEKKDFIFCIRDNGVGFDMRYAQKLFGVFQRMHAQTEFEGTGIGLANVQRIIHKHHGRVWAEAEPNKGAAFFFTLPV